MVHKWTSVYQNRFAISDVFSYRITIFNKSLDSLASLFRTPNNWKALDTALLKENCSTSNLKNSIERLKMLDTAFSRIEKVYFIDEKKLFVSYKTTGDNNTLRKVDIWYNQGNT